MCVCVAVCLVCVYENYKLTRHFSQDDVLEWLQAHVSSAKAGEYASRLALVGVESVDDLKQVPAEVVASIFTLPVHRSKFMKEVGLYAAGGDGSAGVNGGGAAGASGVDIGDGGGGGGLPVAPVVSLQKPKSRASKLFTVSQESVLLNTGEASNDHLVVELFVEAYVLCVSIVVFVLLMVYGGLTHAPSHCRAALHVVGNGGTTWDDMVDPYLAACSEANLGRHPIVITGAVIHQRFLFVLTRERPATILMHPLGLIKARMAEEPPSFLNVSACSFVEDGTRYNF